MKILFLHMFPLWGNGSGNWLRNLTAGLVERGHEVAILAPERRRLPGVKHYVVKPPQMGVFVGNPELHGAKKYEDMSGVELGEIMTTYVNDTLHAVKEFEPEIVHVFHTAFLPPVARIVKVLYGVPYIITTHGSDLNYFERDKRLLGLIDDANTVARCITANSSFTKKWYLDIFGHHLARKTRIVYGGVTLDHFDQPFTNEVAKINKKYKLDGKRVVMFSGRLTKNKGAEYLIKAAKYIDAEIIIMGDGPDRQHLQNIIDTNDLKNVRILGWINPNMHIDFHAFYKRADVYVAPSVWNEPFGLVLLEAMASSKPVVTTKSGGIVSIIKDGKNGVFVPSRNAKAIAEAVNKLLADDKLRETMGKAAFETVKAKFTWAKITEQFEGIYSRHKYSTKEYLKRVRSK